MKNNILSIIGLFIPVYSAWFDRDEKPEEESWYFTISVGHIPIGWIMLAVAVIVKLL